MLRLQQYFSKKKIQRGKAAPVCSSIAATVVVISSFEARPDENSVRSCAISSSLSVSTLSSVILFIQLARVVGHDPLNKKRYLREDG